MSTDRSTEQQSAEVGEASGTCQGQDDKEFEDELMKKKESEKCDSVFVSNTLAEPTNLQRVASSDETENTTEPCDTRDPLLGTPKMAERESTVNVPEDENTGKPSLNKSLQVDQTSMEPQKTSDSDVSARNSTSERHLEAKHLVEGPEPEPSNVEEAEIEPETKRIERDDISHVDQTSAPADEEQQSLDEIDITNDEIVKENTVTSSANQDCSVHPEQTGEDFQSSNSDTGPSAETDDPDFTKTS